MTKEEKHLLIVLACTVLNNRTINKLERDLLANALLPFKQYIEKLGEHNDHA